MTIQHLVWLDDAQDPITDAMLAASMQDENDAIFTCSLTRERGALPAMEVELAHPGWSIYAPSHKQAVALVVSEDGTMATARVRARGYVRAMPSAMTGDTLALQVECSPEDWEDRREVVAAALDAADAVATGMWADAKVGATDPSMRNGLGRDTLFGRSQKLADDIAATRTGWWRHDPVDHDVAFVDDAVRARVHNVGDGYDPDSLQVSEGPGAVEQVTWTVYANIQEAHSGTCDIAPMVGRQISSLVGYQTSGSASMTGNTGWSVDQPQIAQRYDETLPARTGRVWQVRYRQISYIQVPAPGGGTVTATQYSAERTYDHEERQKRRVQYTQVKSWPARYSFSQTRREKFVITLDLPVQRVGGLKRTLDLGETTLGDLYRPDIADEDATILTESDGASGFAAGTYAFLAGKLFLATKDTRDTPYVSKVNRRMKVSTALSGDWIDTGLSAPMPDRSAPSFADTHRGQAAVSHALLRMAKAGLARMVWEVQLSVQRADLPDVELEDRVRFLLPSRYDEEPREATGRVTKIIETWSGEEGETVALTLALPLGTGIDEAPPVSRLGSYGGAGYYGADSGYVPQATATQQAGDSISITISADPLVERIVGKALRNPRYSVLRMEITGESREQIADFARAADAGKAPSADVTRPTSVTPTLLPLISERQIEREIRVSGRLLRAERGLDLGT